MKMTKMVKKKNHLMLFHFLYFISNVSFVCTRVGVGVGVGVIIVVKMMMTMIKKSHF